MSFMAQITLASSTNQTLRKVLLFGGMALLVLVLWEGSKVLFQIPHYKLPHLHMIWEAFLSPTPQGPTWRVLLNDMMWTGYEALAGFTLGGVLGFLLATAFVHSRLIERGLLPYVIASQTVPIIALAPMVVVGVGRMGAPAWLSIAMIAAYLTFFPVTINALRGLTSVDRDSLNLMRSYAASKRQIFFKLRLPASLPYLFTALKISATASVIGAIIGELPSGSPRGLGVQIVYGAQYNTFRPGFLWATILTAALLGVIAYTGVVLVERWVLRWQREK
jgi:NitT/TauT family transport system permease protein